MPDPYFPDLLEDITYSQVHFLEARTDEQFDAPYRSVRMLGMKAGVVNLNNRLYPMGVVQAQIPRAKELISKGRFTGAADHSTAFRSGLLNTVLKGEDIWIGNIDGPNEQSNEVWLAAKLIMTKVGKDVAVILASGIQAGVSARGYGSLKPVYAEDGKTIQYYQVEMDYELVGFDLVIEPSESDARVYRFECREPTSVTLARIADRQAKINKWALKVGGLGG